MRSFIKENYLDNTEIRSALLKIGVNEVFIDKILDRFWFKDYYNSLISYKPYFDILVEHIKKSGYQSFDFLIFYDYLLINLNGGDYTELSDLALVYEQIHSNQIEESRFDELLAKERFNFTKSELILKELIERTTSEKQKNIYIGWKHHRISEYLVAKKFLSNSDPIGEFKKYAIFESKEIKALKPSWLGVFYFLSFSSSIDELVKWVLTFLNENPRSLTEDFAEYLSNIPNLTEDNKTKIFNLIYKNYKDKELWLPVWARIGLGRIATRDILKTLKADIAEQDNSERTYIYRGNVVAIIGHILEDNQKLLNHTEMDFWKKKLLLFGESPDGNGVLQRSCLSALSTFHDRSLINRMAINFDHKDSLVKEAFIRFCYETDPNDLSTIEYLVKGTKSGLDIYARHGLYEIQSFEGIRYFLEILIIDNEFTKQLIERESIFNGDNEKGDQKLINNIRNVLNKHEFEILPLLKKFIFSVCSQRNIYDIDKSYILESITIMTVGKSPMFWKELLDKFISGLIEGENVWAKWNSYGDIFVWLIDNVNIKPIHTELIKINNNGQTIFDVLIRDHVWKFPDSDLISIAKDLNLTDSINNKTTISHDDKEKLQINIQEKFSKLLVPTSDTYNPEVFEFYLNNFDVINTWIITKPAFQKKIKKLIFESNLNLIDLKKFKVKYQDKTQKKGTYNISSIHFYFGNLLRLASKLYPNKLTKYRQKIIDYIPFSFTEDLLTIIELAPDINEEELLFVFGIYNNKANDARYLTPASLNHLIATYVKKNKIFRDSIEILKSFIEDDLIDDYIKSEALENLSSIDNNTKLVGQDYFMDIFKSKTSLDSLRKISNGTLIANYRNDEAVKWRFNEIKEKLCEASGYISPSPLIAHQVSDFEEELTETSLAEPLYDLDAEYYDLFFDLLKYAISNDNSIEHIYVQYIWKIISKYIEKLSLKYGFTQYVRFVVDVNSLINTNPSLTWFRYSIDRIFYVLINKPEKLEDIVSKEPLNA